MYIPANGQFNFDSNLWIDFVEQSAQSQKPRNEKAYICRVIYPPPGLGQVRTFLECKTSDEVKDFLQTNGTWNANCVKMRFRDIICISRICLSVETNPHKKKRLTDSLRLMSDKAEAKYQNGWQGTARRIISWLFNLFESTSSIKLFAMPGNSNVDLKMPAHKQDNLPHIVGSDATFAQLVADCYP